jgi:hypothetical protein
MKSNLILLILSLLFCNSVYSTECPDLSGTYHLCTSTDSQSFINEITITQKIVNGIHIYDESITDKIWDEEDDNRYIADGITYLSTDEGFDMELTASCSQNILKSIAKVKDASDKDASEMSLKTNMYLDKKSNLVIKDFYEDGDESTEVCIRK